MLRKYWFEFFHFALWIVIGALVFFENPIAIFVGLFGIMLCAFAFAASAARGKAEACGLILAAPVIILTIVLPLNRSGALNWLEFYSARHIYEARVRAMPRIGKEPKLEAFHTDERDWLGDKAVIFETLVYDESDEIGRPERERSQAWRDRAAGRLHFHSILLPQMPTHVVKVTPMARHWFWVEQILMQ